MFGHISSSQVNPGTSPDEPEEGGGGGGSEKDV